jgi:hypothetical protein
MMAKESDLSYSKLMDEILNVPLLSAKDVDYRKLRDLLKAGNWHDADMETERAMLQATNREQWIYYDSLRNFPCQDLKTIDALWVAASNGHFGFSVQQRIWAECGSPIAMLESDWYTFCLRVGWISCSRAEHTSFCDLKMNLATSPIGEMPVFGSGWDREDVKSADYFGFAFLAQRLVECDRQTL